MQRGTGSSTPRGQCKLRGGRRVYLFPTQFLRTGQVGHVPLARAAVAAPPASYGLSATHSAAASHSARRPGHSSCSAVWSSDAGSQAQQRGQLRGRTPSGPPSGSSTVPFQSRGGSGGPCLLQDRRVAEEPGRGPCPGRTEAELSGWREDRRRRAGGSEPSTRRAAGPHRSKAGRSHIGHRSSGSQAGHVPRLAVSSPHHLRGCEADWALKVLEDRSQGWRRPQGPSSVTAGLSGPGGRSLLVGAGLLALSLEGAGRGVTREAGRGSGVGSIITCRPGFISWFSLEQSSGRKWQNT